MLILLSTLYLKRAKLLHQQSDITRINMYLLVPVLLEQDIIEDSFYRFITLLEGRPWLHLVFISTAKEQSLPNRPTTQSILGELINKRRQVRVHLIHYPYRYGVMAHQLNYAIEQLLSENSEPFLIGVYNADSHPPVEGIEFAYEKLRKDIRLVLQQYSYYPYPKPTNIEQCILSHIALWQTRWSLQFELGRLLLDHMMFRPPHKADEPLNLIRPFHYVIGHGLFMSSVTWQLTTGFPEDEINEDAFLGYIIHLAGIRIEPIPWLERSESPPSLRVYLKQQSVWFNGPLFAWRYARKMWFGSHDRLKKRNIMDDLLVRINTAIAATKLQLHAIYWLAGPPVLLFLVPLYLTTHAAWLALAFWILLLVLYTYCLNLQAYYALQNLGIDIVFHPGGIISALLAYALHCVGPVLCILKTVIGRNRIDIKYKTERR